MNLDYYLKRGVIKLDHEKISRWFDNMESLGIPLHVLMDYYEKHTEDFVVLTV